MQPRLQAPKADALLRQVGLWLFAIAAIYVVVLAAVSGIDTVAADFVAEAKKAPAWTLPALGSCALAAYFVRALRWCLLARHLGITAPFAPLAAVYVGGFTMILTPGRVGELWRAWILRQGWGVELDRGVSLVICDRFLDLNALLLFAALGVAVGGALLWPGLVGCAALAALAAMVIVPGWARLGVKTAWRVAGRRAPRLFAGLLATTRNLAGLLRLRVYAPAAALSLLAWGMEVVAIVIGATALGAQLGMPAAAASLGVANIAGVLTHLPGGIGGQEVALSFFLARSGLQLASAIALVTLVRLATLWLSILLGLPFFVQLTRRHGGG